MRPSCQLPSFRRSIPAGEVDLVRVEGVFAVACAARVEARGDHESAAELARILCGSDRVSEVVVDISAASMDEDEHTLNRSVGRVSGRLR